MSIDIPDIGDEKTYLNNKYVDVFEYMLRLTGLANLTGLPALSIPCGMHNKLPVGVQLIGPYDGEERIFRIAHAIEKMQND